jgi:3-phosphoshikimate 1-carboxyvinyltransferase
MRVEPASRLTGDLTPPPDKSISHRAALIAAMSDGPVLIRGCLRSADTAATLDAVRTLGAEVEERPRDEAVSDVSLRGLGLRGIAGGREAIDVRNAGTLLRLLPGWLAGQESGHWELDGDESIRRRPVDRVVEPLRRMGGRVACRDGRLPPIAVDGSNLEGITYELPVASAQVKSCLLIAGMLARGETTVVESLPTRDHTEIMLAAAGAPVEVMRSAPTAPARVSVHAAERLELDQVSVPGDLSSAAFFAVAATLVPGSRVRLRAVGVNPTRTGIITVMKRMGASIELEPGDAGGGEPVADLTVSHAQLVGTLVEGAEVPILIDELPLVGLLGAFAEGGTVVRGAGELRHKESDRIATVVAGLAALGVAIEATDDGFAVEGGNGVRGGTLDAAGDHRLAMLGAVAGLASREGVEVRGFEAAAVSYPRFAHDLAILTGI